MESKIIKAFFDGTLSDEMIDVPTTKEYDKINARETELYEKLRATLSAEQIKLFDEFVEQYSYRHSLIAESYYVRGFKFGVRRAVECFGLYYVDTRS